MKKTIYAIKIAILLVSVAFIGLSFSTSAAAKEQTEEFAGKIYCFDKDNDWEISQSNPVTNISQAGSLSLSGDYVPLAERNGFQQISVKSGNISFKYNYDISTFSTDKDKWHKYSCSDSKIDGLELKDDVLSGALIVRSSLDCKKWITDVVRTDIFNPEYVLNQEIYNTTDIQLVNGCYYIITVAYEEEIVAGVSDYWIVSFDDEEYRKIAEEYKFYIVDTERHDFSDINLTPRKEMGQKIGVKVSGGYSEEVKIDIDDPHYGWEIGTFSVNGYTRETVDAQGNPLFLKNVGNKVTLWFKLKQDIDCLNGNPDYFINADEDGYDQYMGIPKTDFGRGVLLIRHIDHEGVIHDPVIYTDFLEANTTTGAETRAVLFEEGDYEVALNYEILDDGLIGERYDYRIFFKFSIRNGNTMVFPFDLATGSELVDNSVTPNGFLLDLAKSRYLVIDVKREVVVEGENGYGLDVRYNRPAKDGDEYKDDGIYTVSVKNLYTNEQTEKKFYVGSDSVYYALAKNNISINELNDAIQAGATIESDGLIRIPMVIEKEPEETEEVTITPVEEKAKEEPPAPQEVINDKIEENIGNNVISENSDIDEPEEDAKNIFRSPVFVWIIIPVVAIIALLITLLIIKRSKKNKLSKKNSENEETREH